ncbi:MAG: hypothetical protein V2A74_10580 [bacterium]
MRRMHLATISAIIFLWIAGVACLFAADPEPSPSPETDEQAVRKAAETFLEAWSFKDYDEARKLLAPDSTGTSSTEAAEQVLLAMSVIIPEKHAVAGVSQTDDGYKVRYEVEGLHRVSGQRGIERGTLAFVRTSEGKWRIRLTTVGSAPAAAASSPLPAAPAASTLPPSQTIDGWDVTRVLKFLTDQEQKWNSLRCNLSLTGQMLGQPIQYSGEVVFQKPDKVMVNLNLFEIHCNGQQTFLYVPAAQAYYMKSGPIGGGAEDVGSIVGIGGADLAQRYHVALVGAEPVSGRAAFKLLLQPRQSASGLLGGGTLTMWVDRENGLPLQTHYSDAMGGSITVSYTNYAENPPVNSSIFDFTPPPGSMALPSFPGLEGIL